MNIIAIVKEKVQIDSDIVIESMVGYITLGVLSEIPIFKYNPIVSSSKNTMTLKSYVIEQFDDLSKKYYKFNSEEISRLNEILDSGKEGEFYLRKDDIGKQLRDCFPEPRYSRIR